MITAKTKNMRVSAKCDQVWKDYEKINKSRLKSSFMNQRRDVVK